MKLYGFIEIENIPWTHNFSLFSIYTFKKWVVWQWAYELKVFKWLSNIEVCYYICLFIMKLGVLVLDIYVLEGKFWEIPCLYKIDSLMLIHLKSGGVYLSYIICSTWKVQILWLKCELWYCWKTSFPYHYKWLCMNSLAWLYWYGVDWKLILMKTL